MVVFRLPADFRSQEIDGECEENTFPTQTFCPYVTHDITRSRVAQVVSSIKSLSSSCHLSGTPCRLIHTARLLCCSLHCPHQCHFHFPALAQRRFNQEPAPIHTALEVTVLRNPILLHLPSWRAGVFWTSLRKLVPVAIPRTPQSRFCSAVMDANMNGRMASLGTAALSKSSAAELSTSNNSASSRHALRISFVLPTETLGKNLQRRLRREIRDFAWDGTRTLLRPHCPQFVQSRHGFEAPKARQ